MNEGKELNAKQVFVRNLAFDVTNDDLSALFEDIGPLKNTSVAATNGVGKGFGFVKFSLAEDAAAAIEKLQGSLFRGRKLILELGLKKERTTSKIKQQKQRREEEGGEGEEKGDDAEADADAEVEAEAEVEEEVPAETAAEAAVKKKAKFLAEKEEKQAARDAQAASVRRSRQLLIFGIPIDLNKRGFKTLALRGHPKTECELLKEDHELSPELLITSPPGKIMLLTAYSKPEATKLQSLNGSTLHSLLVAHLTHLQKANNKAPAKGGALMPDESTDEFFTSKNSRNRKEKLIVRTMAQITPEDQRKRRCRLIVRNLSFLATEQNVSDKMAKFGPLAGVELPMQTIDRSEGDGGRGGRG
ncbi:hypothetical protein B484DRAFT_480150, partial [Ochromonadaceae sp. CCMP2298]